MAFDGVVLAAVKAELEAKLTGGRIDKIHQPEKEELIISVRQPGENHRLLISAHAQNARTHLTGQARANPLTPPLFCMVLRKHLEGGRIRRLVQPGLERILHIYIEAYDELGNLGEKLLICEFMGKHSNIILAEPDENSIIDSIKRVPHFLSRHREVLPGRSYIAPPAQEKLNPLETGEETFREVVYGSSLEARLEKTLLNNFTGLSPQTCKELVYRAGLPEATTVNQCGEYELQRLWENFKVISAMEMRNSFEPTLVRDEKGRVLAFSALRLTHLGELPQESGAMNQVIDAFYREREEENLLLRDKNALLKVIRSELERNQKKLSIQEEALSEGAGTEKFRIWGELITANLYRLEKGPSEVLLPDFYDPEGKEVTIPMNPQLTPAENAQAYFRKYTRARDSKTVIEEQKNQAQNEISYLESVVASIEGADSRKESEEVREELIQQGYIREKVLGKPGAKKPKTEIKPLTFKSSEGLEILVGKNNRQNDYLTLKLAKPEDIWFHVKDIPGSHVILRQPEKGEISNESLEQAAALAAYHSKARESGKVAVDFTLKKHVHKPKGAKPGMVIYDNQHTVYVAPRLIFTVQDNQE